MFIGWSRRSVYRLPGATALVSVSRVPKVETRRVGHAILAVEIVVIAATLVWIAHGSVTVAVGCLVVLAVVLPGIVQIWWTAARGQDPDWQDVVHSAARLDARPDVLSGGAAWPQGQGHFGALLDELLAVSWPHPILAHARTEALAQTYTRRWGFEPTRPGGRTLIRPADDR